MMSTSALHTLNQRYIKLTDRCRSQWTFFQLLQGAFKHLRDAPSPVDIDYQALFARFRALAEELAHPETSKVERVMDELEGELSRHSRALLEADREMPPSMLRRFFDSLRRQDEKVVLAIVKFYLDGEEIDEDIVDKLDILFTRLAELPREGGGTLSRERHEMERLLQPLLQHRRQVPISEAEAETVLANVSDIRAQALAARSFSELASGGALDRFRGVKRSLGTTLIHPLLLPSILEATVAIKNRFRELWEDEEHQLMDDTNRVMEVRRFIDKHPEVATSELRDLFDSLTAAQQRLERGRKEEKLRREDVLDVRRTLDRILEQSDRSLVPPPAEAGWVTGPPPVEPLEDLPAGDEGQPALPADLLAGRSTVIADQLRADPLLHEYLSKILFAFELVGPDRPPAEIAHAKEVAALRLDAWEVEAIQRVTGGGSGGDTIAGERERLTMQATALRVRLDEEAREIDRLRKRGSERLAELLERATHSLQRAAELDRRFQWFIEDALYRGSTESLEALFRSRMRLVRAYSGLWLIHNDSGGVSPF